MFDSLKSLGKAAIGIATLPVDIVADIATLGGSLNDKGESYTGNKCEKIIENIDRAVDPNE